MIGRSFSLPKVGSWWRTTISACLALWKYSLRPMRVSSSRRGRLSSSRRRRSPSRRAPKPRRGRSLSSRRGPKPRRGRSSSRRAPKLRRGRSPSSRRERRSLGAPSDSPSRFLKVSSNRGRCWPRSLSAARKPSLRIEPPSAFMSLYEPSKILYSRNSHYKSPLSSV